MSELSEAINEMRNMRESYDQIGAAAEAYNTGKTELAANITAKGVQASAEETLPELAQKVAAITQETYEINGGEMYAKQLFGSLETPNYWNLYDILAQLLSDGRLVSYGGILLAEYYKGYDSLELEGAGAGGAYVVSDLDENGQFKMYTEDTTHVWATEFDGMGNRWVAYCFADEYHDFQITDTNTSPRSIFIGRKVGTITSLVNGRISEIVVPDGNKLRNIASGTYTQNFGRVVVFRNIESAGTRFFNGTGNARQELVFLECNHVDGGSNGCIKNTGNKENQLKCVIIKANRITGVAIEATGGFFQGSVFIEAEEIISSSSTETTINRVDGDVQLYIKTESLTGYLFGGVGNQLTGKLYLGYISNNKNKSVSVVPNYVGVSAMKVELQDGWCKPLNIRDFSGLTKEKVQSYIFDRLGVNDLSTGAVTITLATAVLNLFTQEEIDAVVARTNITIVGA